ncbi:MAG TPA: F0F1 ATP synthase subunit epsilon [Thermodesulfovibrionales bacterium]|nr:F0F1 ATP synthase subunit epsilon [Thermodesulfovibrionales bacterium]
MSDSLFTLRIVTPPKITEKRIKTIRLKDGSGFFGIMKGHINFVTAIEPSLCYYLDENDREVFLAVDGGIVRVKGGMVTITSRAIFESDDAEKLAEIIENTIVKRDSSERSFLNMIKGIERSFMEKTLEFVRGGS